jgi:hypothetical protein
MAVPTLMIPVGARTNVNAKALQILLERRLTVTAIGVGYGTIQAECRGSDTIYHLGRSDGKWYCSCEHKGQDCSHLRALHHVVVRPEP